MNPQPVVFIRQSGKNVRLELRSILYIEARKNYSYVVAVNNNYLVLAPLSEWIAVLPEDRFCRIHRGYIVAIPHIDSFDHKFVCLPGAELPIGETYRHALPGKVALIGGETRNRSHAGTSYPPSLTKLQHTA